MILDDEHVRPAGDPWATEDRSDAIAHMLEALHPEWHRRAACRGEDPAVFFVGSSESTAPARAFCAGCAVRVECAEQGLGEVFGVWGGLGQNDRLRLRRRRAA